MACLRLLTSGPFLLPEWSLPLPYSRMTREIFFWALVFLRAIRVPAPVLGFLCVVLCYTSAALAVLVAPVLKVLDCFSAADEVKKSAFQVGRSVREALSNLADRLSHQLAGETDPVVIHQLLSDEHRDALMALMEVEG